VRLLLDSHVVLWWLTSDPRLGPRCVDMIVGADEVAFSAVTPWELGIKRASGKLSYPDDMVAQLRASGFVERSITVEDGVLAAELPPHHRDPFDRMLIAQAISSAFVLVTSDDQLAAYEVALLDAGA